MIAPEARKRIKRIRRHYLCSVCLIPKAFCREHSKAQRKHAIKALKAIARRRKRKPKPKRTKTDAHEQNNPPVTK